LISADTEQRYYTLFFLINQVLRHIYSIGRNLDPFPPSYYNGSITTVMAGRFCAAAISI